MGFWEPLFFWIFAVGAVLTSLGVLVFRNPLYSALALIADFFCFAALYALLAAHFMAITQVLVYAGAIMVLFVFIIMLLNLSDAELGSRQFNLHHVLAILGGAGVIFFSVYTIVGLVDSDRVREVRASAEAPAEEGVRIDSTVPGLYAHIDEAAMDRIYRERIQSWVNGESTPADGDWVPYQADRTFAIPPVLKRNLPPGPQMPGEGQVRADQRKGGMFGTVEPISILLVNRYVIAFELTAVLLLAAIVGAVIIAKKRL